jgi:dTDP-D-glucose 4,6-dehydratase
VRHHFAYMFLYLHTAAHSLTSVLKVAQDLLDIFGIDQDHVATKQTTAVDSDHDAIVPETPDQLLKKADKDTAQSLNFVEDRAFNDLRYTVNSDALKALGWQEEMSWKEGLQTTVDWYKAHSDRFGNIEQALMAHPRAGLGLDVTDVVSLTHCQCAICLCSMLSCDGHAHVELQ